MGREQGPGFYDQIYARGYNWQRYTRIYEWVADRAVEPILDLGCGVGGLARILHQRGVKQYTGIDFSPVAIQWARGAAPYRFIVRNLTGAKLDEFRFSTVAATEFLEHIEADMELCRQIPAGVRVLGSVPTIGGSGHVRCFPRRTSLEERYGSVFRFKEIEFMPNYWWAFHAEAKEAKNTVPDPV